MQRLYQNLSMATYPQLLTLQVETASVNDIKNQTSLMLLWRSLLCFRKWIGGTGHSFCRLLSENYFIVL